MLKTILDHLNNSLRQFKRDIKFFLDYEDFSLSSKLLLILICCCVIAIHILLVIRVGWLVSTILASTACLVTASAVYKPKK